MKTKKPISPKPEKFESPGPEPVKVAQERESGNGYRPGSRIQFNLNEDGSIDLDSMRDKTLERLRAAIGSTPGIRTEVQTATPVMLFPPPVIHAMYQSISLIETMIAPRFGISPVVAKNVFTFTPEELSSLTPLTARVLQKHMSQWMLTWQEELMLGSLLLSMTVSKINAAITLMRMSQVQTAQTEEKPPEEPQPKAN